MSLLDMPPVISALLSGPAWVYGALMSFRERAYDGGSLETVRVPVPVFCVGNLTVGGTGKTPGVIWLTRYLLEKGRRPAILTRGYKRSLVSHAKASEPVIVSDGRRHMDDVRAAGDEPMLIARRLIGVPVLAGSDRALVAQKAVEEFSADCLVMDDGYQHLRLYRDVNLLCVDTSKDAALFLGGPARVLPAGRLREPLSALRRAHVVFLTKYNFTDPATAARLCDVLRERLPDTPVVPVRYELSLLEPSSGKTIPVKELERTAVLAVSGLAAPESFEEGLRRLGARVTARRFPDHHFFTDAERADILRQARSADQKIVVTEKDYQRLPKDFPCLVALLQWVPDGTDDKGRMAPWLKKIDSAIS